MASVETPWSTSHTVKSSSPRRRRAEAGFEILHVDAYQPHYVAGPYKSFWSWTFHESAPNAIKMGLLSDERWRHIAEDMRAADDDPNVLVAHARTGQLIARNPI